MKCSKCKKACHYTLHSICIHCTRKEIEKKKSQGYFKNINKGE